MRRQPWLTGLLTVGLLAAAGAALAAPPEADAAFEAGLSAAKAGDLATAAGYWERALQLYEATPGDDRAHAVCLMSLGSAYRALGNPQRAVGTLALGLEALRKLPQTERQQAVCLQNLALSHADLGEPQQALDCAQQAAALFAELQAMQWEQAQCLATMANAAALLGQPQKVLEWSEQAAGLFAKVEGAERERFGCLLSMGAAYGDLGRHQQEAETTEQALDLARKLPDSAWEQAGCLQNLGVAYGKLGDLGRKLELTRQALALFGTVPATERKQAECLQNLGATYLELGRAQEALASTQYALGLYRKVGDAEAQQAACLLNLAAILGELEQPERELEVETEALETLRELPGTQRQQAECLTNLGITSLALGREEEALSRLREAEELFRGLARELGSVDAPWVPEALVVAEAGLGKAYSIRDGEGDSGRAYLRYAAAIHLLERLRATAASAPEMRARFFGRLAWVYEDVIEVLAGMEERTDGAAPPTAAAGPGGLSGAQTELGELWDDLHLPAPDLWPGWESYREGILHYSEASRARVLRDILASDLGNTGGSELAALNAAVARERELAERLAAASGMPEAGALRAQLAEAGRERQQAEMAWSRTAVAKVAEAAPLRLRAVQALLRDGQALVEYKLLPGKLLILVVTPQGLRMVVRPVHRETGLAPGAIGAPVLDRLQQLQLAAGEAEGLPQGTRLPLEPRELLREFGVEELVWLYRRPMEALGSADERLRAEALGGQAQQIRVAAALYELLLRPVEGMVGQGATAPALLVVPDGALYYLPFGALVARLPEDVDAAPEGNVWAAPGVQYAVERWEISHLPSASMYAAMRSLAVARPPPERRLCAIGDAVYGGPPSASEPGSGASALPPGGHGPPAEGRDGNGGSAAEVAPTSPLPLPRLPGTRREAELALRAFAGQRGVVCEAPTQTQWGQHVALMSLAATETALKAPQVEQYGYLLLATHGVISPSSAALSYVALTPSAEAAEDGRLYMTEVFGLHLNAQVVTLSGCRTAEGSFARGEGTLGLTAAFFAAGARAVTASLWAVADESTAELVGDYHRRMASGMGPAAALREGQLATLKRARAAPADEARLAHPYEWGAFVVLGG